MANDQSKKMVKVIFEALDEHKGRDVSILDIGEVSVIADYFVIATADNVRQVEALTDAVEEKMFKAGFDLRKKEGVAESGWILMDFNDVIVHIFDKEQRLFYDLERIWSDGKKVVDIAEL